MSLTYCFIPQSVVIISRLPFISLFTEVIGLIAPEFFDHGEPSLESACHDVDQWPFPVPGRMVTLPIFGTAIQVSEFYQKWTAINKFVICYIYVFCHCFC